MELVKDYVHPETGEIVNKDRLELKGLGYTKFILKEGGTLGDLYTNADFIRDDKGYIQIDKNGDVAKTDNLPDIKLGSVFPIKCPPGRYCLFSHTGCSRPIWRIRSICCRP